MVELELESSTNSKPVITIPLDFLANLNFQPVKGAASMSATTQETEPQADDTLNQIIQTILMTIKQVLYQRASELQEEPKGKQAETIIVMTLSESKNGKVKELKREIAQMV